MYIQFFILLYADDTVIFGTDEREFQNHLNVFYDYSNMWRLDINYDKTKIFIFGIVWSFWFQNGWESTTHL